MANNTAANKHHYATAIELRDMLDAIIEKNPEAMLMMSTDNGSGYLVIDDLNTELDSDGDARFTVRDWETGRKVEVIETEDLPYQ